MNHGLYSTKGTKDAGDIMTAYCYTCDSSQYLGPHERTCILCDSRNVKRHKHMTLTQFLRARGP